MLLGTTLLGSLFLQDTNTNYIKINSVVLGESNIYSYKSVYSRDISTLLKDSLLDSKIICILYDWKSGNAYMKTGYNLHDNSDYKYNKDFTTYIVKSKIKDLSFVSWNNNDFIYNYTKFIPLGFNAYWLGLTEQFNYPSKNQVIEIFDIATKMKATTIRSHTLGISSGSKNSLRPNSNILNEDAWDAIDFAFYTAEKYNIKIIAPLTDAYNYANGNYGDFCKTRNVPKDTFFTDLNVRNDFKDYIFKWLNHINKYNGIQVKNNPTIAFIELGNELGNYRPDTTSIAVPTEEWLNDISTFIKSIDKNHLILGPSDECLGQNTSNDFKVKNIDVFSSHFYSEDYTRLDNNANIAKSINKGYIIGEYSSHFNINWLKQIEKRKNVKGDLFWSIYPHENGMIGGNKVEHNDGFTLYYPEDTFQLTVISNHFRRIQNIAQVYTI